MHKGRILIPGLLITIEIRRGEDWPFVIGSVSENSSSITCEALIDYHESPSINKGDELIITCITENGIYRFPTKVNDIIQNPLQLTLDLLKGANHLQRRDFFRLSRPQIRVRYRPIEGPEDIVNDDLSEVPVKDLSGNGIALIIPKEDELESGMPVKIEIELSSGQVINLVGEVVRCLPNQPINDRSLLCIYFSLIEEKERDRIVGHLFREQLNRIGRRRQSPRRG